MSDFFCSCGRPGAAGGFRGLNFCKKISRAKHAQPKDASWKRPLLPQIKYSTKYVKLQELNHTYSIPYFLTNTTAKPQNLPANASAAALLFCRQKRSAANAAPQAFQSKNFCLQGLFLSACSIHAFISTASVLKSFFITTSMSSTLCRPSFR